MVLHALLESTLVGLGYELVDLEISGRQKRLLRVFIDKPNGINIDDCVLVSDHLGKLLVVEGVDYDRLEVSSPGLDRPLKREADFLRFNGEKAQIKLRVPVSGQRNFAGILRDVKEGWLQLEVDGELVPLELANMDKARLVPNI
jgi:ribosome maturation factor RimP